MKSIASFMVSLGFVWIGFGLRVIDPEMDQQLRRALEDNLSKYP